MTERLAGNDATRDRVISAKSMDELIDALMREPGNDADVAQRKTLLVKQASRFAGASGEFSLKVGYLGAQCSDVVDVGDAGDDDLKVHIVGTNRRAGHQFHNLDDVSGNAVEAARLSEPASVDDLGDPVGTVPLNSCSHAHCPRPFSNHFSPNSDAKTSSTY